MAKAVIVGSKGQDGTLLSKLLESKGYEVVGIDKNCDVDILDIVSVDEFMSSSQPDELYYLAAFHHSSQDKKPENIFLFRQSFDINLFGLINFLEAINTHSLNTKVFYAASSHLFGNTKETPQTEETPINPANIYGISKAAALFACRYYRENHGIFASVGILYNHESNLRKETFLTKKVTNFIKNAVNGDNKKLSLSSLDQKIDMGFANDYVVAMWKILSLDKSDDFIISTGYGRALREFVKLAFMEADLDYRDHVNELKDSNDKPVLIGSNKKIQEKTNWKPSISFEEMIKVLVRDVLNNKGNQ